MASYDPFETLRSTHGTENVNMAFDSLRPVIIVFIAMVLLQQYFGLRPLRLTLYKTLSLLSCSLCSVLPQPVLNLLLRIASKTLTLLPSYNLSLLSPRLSGVLPSLFKNMNQDSPAGLGNFDNSCYQNSILQGLSSLLSVQKFLYDMTLEFQSLGPQSINATLASLLATLNSPFENGKTLWTPQKLKTMDSINPQDAHEYFGSMMEYTEKELSKCIQERFLSDGWADLREKLLKENPDLTTFDATTVKNLRRFQNPLDGLFADRTMCMECGYSEGLRLVDFNCLLTQFPKYPGYNYFHLQDLFREYMKLEKVGPTRCAKCTLLKTRTSLEQLLNASQAKELPASEEFKTTAKARLDAVNDLLTTEDFGEDDKYLVTKCGLPKKKWTETMKTKQSVIARAPQSFAVNINRSELDETTFQLRKNLSTVSYPTDLDLSPWVLGNLDGPLVPNSIIQPPSPMTDPMQCMLPKADEINPDLSSQLQYELRAVVRHQGYGHNNGHYICYKKHDLRSQADSHDEKVSSSEQWWSLSDEDVRVQDEQTVLEAQGVFMLFYERKLPGTVTKSPVNIPQKRPVVEAPVVVMTEEDWPTLGSAVVQAPPKKKARVRSKDRNKLQEAVPTILLPSPDPTPDASRETTPTSSNTETADPPAQPLMNENAANAVDNSGSQQNNNVSEPASDLKPTTNTVDTSVKTQQPVPMRTAGAGKRRKGRKSLRMVEAS